AIDDVEKKAGLKPKSICKARYIKPIARHNPGQRTAHAIFTFSTKEGANHTIKFGLAVAGKKVYGRKLIQEPTRCLKCQSFNSTHVAAKCLQEHDTCGACGGQHRTATCTVTDQNRHCCKNCNVEGHAAWSCDCPMFMGKWDSLSYTTYPVTGPKIQISDLIQIRWTHLSSGPQIQSDPHFISCSYNSNYRSSPFGIPVHR
ncbi:hypothetical protein F4604DRAFT_1596142, partial [Suillus subluteus]